MDNPAVAPSFPWLLSKSLRGDISSITITAPGEHSITSVYCGQARKGKTDQYFNSVKGYCYDKMFFTLKQDNDML